MRTTVSETMDKMNEQGVLQYAIDWLRDNGFTNGIDYHKKKKRLSLIYQNAFNYEQARI